jgi:PP-loop superfamily ATP-utilizing enzyme
MKAEQPLPSTDEALTAAWAPVFHELGLPSYRVRAEEGMLCIEAPPEDIARLLAPQIRTVLVKHGKALGYRFVTLDLG